MRTPGEPIIPADIRIQADNLVSNFFRHVVDLDANVTAILKSTICLAVTMERFRCANYAQCYSADLAGEIWDGIAAPSVGAAP
jgi:hypothetical protein